MSKAQHHERQYRRGAQGEIETDICNPVAHRIAPRAMPPCPNMIRNAFIRTGEVLLFELQPIVGSALLRRT